MRRIWGWAREVAWLNVLAVVLLVAAIVVASVALTLLAWAPLALVLAGGSITLSVLGLRS